MTVGAFPEPDVSMSMDVSRDRECKVGHSSRRRVSQDSVVVTIKALVALRMLVDRHSLVLMRFPCWFIPVGSPVNIFFLLYIIVKYMQHGTWCNGHTS